MRYPETCLTPTQPLNAPRASDHRAEQATARDSLDAMRTATLAANRWSGLTHAMMVRGAASFAPPFGGRSLLGLQRQYGNRYVQRVLNRSRQCEGETGIDPEVDSPIERARGGGQSLDARVRLQTESAFGTDFGGVRVHTDSGAHALNEALRAVAFTTGQDIFFRDGAYNPGSSGGKELLAHELTHVVQQGGSGAVQCRLVLGEPGDSYEQEADSVAKQVVAVMDGGSVYPTQFSGESGSGSAQRQCACGGHAASGECKQCREKREATIARRVMRQPERSLQRQDDGGDGGVVDGGITDGGSLPGGVSTPPTDGGTSDGAQARTPDGTGDGCQDECERQFNDCINPPWWQFWKTPKDASQCEAERTACLQGCSQGPSAGRWSCDASCNVEGTEPQCTGRVTGHSSGHSSEEEACREAKRDATQKAPRGCYARHCRCLNCTNR